VRFRLSRHAGTTIEDERLAAPATAHRLIQTDAGCPLVDRANAERVERFVQDAEKYSRVLVRGGRITEGPLAKGAFFRPAMLEPNGLDTPMFPEGGYKQSGVGRARGPKALEEFQESKTRIELVTPLQA
jgi:acyl-CoA reductase-like NAD-dependent aldehyde dehydrogenase